ncbi:MAG: tRNA pseudouridine(38-40) synthase TruA [Alphaproteobacteria bacterium]|nr:tRNA pseudouridine(38-40) synthase TruA [Alphaproteobacteria bacterium]
MTRFKLVVEYDGTGFAGWQSQASGSSIQSALEAAILGFSGERVRVHGAGRTDAGVHALGQCCHFDLEREITPSKLRDALNAHLRPHAIAVLDATHVDATFNARRDARERSYRYRIVNRPAPLAIELNRAWQVRPVLDVEAMREAASLLIGRHDFSTFRAAECQARSPVRTLDRLDVVRAGEEITIETSARSFLHNQVRAMVGSLALVGRGKWSVDDFNRALKARDRTKGGPNAPPYGLYLVSVRYQ